MLSDSGFPNLGLGLDIAHRYRGEDMAKLVRAYEAQHLFVCRPNTYCKVEARRIDSRVLVSEGRGHTNLNPARHQQRRQTWACHLACSHERPEPTLNPDD